MKIKHLGKYAVQVSALCGCSADFCNDPECPDYRIQMGYRDKCSGAACQYSHAEAERLVEAVK